jgi:hypothetical protein
MSHAFVMLVALSGLGCQNKTGDSSDPPAALVPTPASPAQDAPAAIPSPAQAAPAAGTSPSPEASSAGMATSPEAPAASTTPPPYPRYFTEPYSDPEALYSTPSGCLYATLYSFVWGKDPGIPSAAEIEASALGYGSPSGTGH